MKIELLLCLFLISCGQNYSQKSGSNTLSGIDEISTEGQTAEDTRLAFEVCKVLKNKRLNYAQTYQAKQFKYLANFQNCYGNFLSDQVQANINGSQISTSYAYIFPQYIETDKTGNLKDICQQIEDHKAPGLTFRYQSNKKIVYSFIKESDGIQVKKEFFSFVKNNTQDETETFQSSIEYKINSKSALYAYGQVNYFKYKNLCPKNSAQSYSLQQIYLNK